MMSIPMVSPRSCALAALAALAALSAVQACETQEPSEEQRQAFRAAKTAALVVDQLYPDAEGVSLPIAAAGWRLLGYCGLTKAAPGAAADLAVSITVTGYPDGSQYDPGQVFLYTGAFLEGEVGLAAANVPEYTAFFSGQYGPESVLVVQMGGQQWSRLNRPSGAPFRAALAEPGSLYAILLQTLRQVFGADAVARALGDRDPDMRLAAALDLVSVGDTRATPALSALLQGTDAYRRQRAAEALGELRDPAAVPSLIAALQGGPVDVRESAAVALGDLRDSRAVAPLSRALKSQDPTLRTSAAAALAEIGDKDAVPALIGSLGHRDEYTREAAAEALQKLTGQDFGEDPAQWRAWWEQEKATLAPKQ